MKSKDIPRLGSKLITKAIIVTAKAVTKGVFFVGKNAIKGVKEALNETSEAKKVQKI